MKINHRGGLLISSNCFRQLMMGFPGCYGKVFFCDTELSETIKMEHVSVYIIFRKRVGNVVELFLSYV